MNLAKCGTFGPDDHHIGLREIGLRTAFLVHMTASFRGPATPPLRRHGAPP